ncbi:tetratricopeptide repeat protein [Microcoleus sp. FACHB-831]|nr:tetratricopeptide repeat protein [Microcoleus sp. FACHB-831]
MVTDTAPPKVSSWNRQTYQRLKLALSLGLRRQIYLAVCDDLILRNRIANRLYAELGHPQLVNINLNPQQPNPIAQIAQWFATRSIPRVSLGAPAFQILGVELLTKQSASVQALFLRHLGAIERSMLLGPEPINNVSLLLWLPQPWFHSIQQSAPEFWRWHTGVFEFEGEPTPLPPTQRHRPEVSLRTAVGEETPVRGENLKHIVPIDLAGERRDREQKEEIKESQEQRSRNQELQNAPANTSRTAQNPDERSGGVILPALQEIDQLAKSSPDPTVLVEAYLKLGNHYRDRVEQGDATPENLITAIQAYERALQCVGTDYAQASDILNDLGNLYWMLSRSSASPEEILSYLEQGIQAYHLALTKVSADASPLAYAMIQNNLGAAYGDLARYRDSAINLELAVQAYQQALRYRRPLIEGEDATVAMRYASTQNNLGTAYWHLAQHQDPHKNLKLAIDAYSEAVSYYHPEQEPINWAMIQNNLGTAYWNLAQYEQPEEFLPKAIEAYQNALKYRTPEVVPAASAATQNNLGTAYWHLANSSQSDPLMRQEYLRLCIMAYLSAIALAHGLATSTPQVVVSFDVFATYNNLGLAQYQVATDSQFSLESKQKSAHLDAALHHHLLALQGFSNQIRSVGTPVPLTDNYQAALNYVVRTIRTFYREEGIQGQSRALSKVPGQFLPEILPKL